MLLTARSILPLARDLPDSRARQLADAVMNLFYPEHCAICCAEPIWRHVEYGVCRRCWENSLRLCIARPWCPCCGLPFHTPDPQDTHLCSQCATQVPPFSGARSFGYYTGELSRVIQQFKFRGRRNLAALLAPLLARTFCESWEQDEFDLIVPVPLHRKRQRRRGFNQAAILGARLGRLLAIPWTGDVLRRSRDTRPQVGLTDSERQSNLHRAFRCDRPAALAGKRVLLLDDVMTTGATLASAADALLEGGAKQVSALTVARAVRQ
jgi:ComF family protein